MLAGFDITFFTLNNNLIVDLPDDAFSGLSFRPYREDSGPILHLSHNQITSIAQHVFRGIDASTLGIDFSDCDLSEFPGEALNAFPNLTVIMLHNNHITEIPDAAFRTFSMLRSLNIGGNTIRNINREELLSGVEATLDSLHLTSMGLTRFPTNLVKNLEKLRRIDMSSNAITELPADLFVGFHTKIKLEVKLEMNNMSSISPHVFRGAHIGLSKLDLDVNQLTNLDFIDLCSSIFKGTNTLPSIAVVENPLRCDCDTFQHLDPKVVTVTGSCDMPLHYRGLRLYRGRDETDFYRNASDMCVSGSESLMTSHIVVSIVLTIAYISFDRAA